MQDKQKKLLPVTVLSGFLGSGKTTILNAILKNRQGLKVAVIVNDMSEVNIDVELIANNDVSLSKTEEKLVELSNGCICCTLREDLLIEVKKLALENKFDYLVIESTGISEPLPIAETFTFDDESGDILSHFARLDTMVTVVDTANFMNYLASEDQLKDTDESLGEEDTRTIVGLLTDQIEFADVIVLSKVDLVSKDTVGTIRGIVAKLNPDARIIEAVKGDISLEKILNTGLFDFDKASQNIGWLKEMRGEHTPETEEYGISSFVYESKKPFDRQKLMELLQNGTLQGVVRSKGFAWDNSDLTTALLWSQAGNIINLDPYGYWSKSKAGESKGEQKIVFIGANMDKKVIIEALDKCLVSL